MRVPASSSIFLAALASSSSIADLVAAAPTDSKDRNAVATTTPRSDAPAIPDLNGVLGTIGTSGVTLPGTRRDDVEARGLLDVLGPIGPLVDTVLTLLGLKTPSALSAEGAPIVPEDQVNQIKAAISALTGGTLPLPLPPAPLNGLPIPGAPTGSTDTNANGTAPAANHTARADLSARQDDGSCATPLQAAGLPSIPVSLPAGLPTALPTPPGGLPTLPVGVPPPPGGLPALPVGVPAPPAGLPLPVSPPTGNGTTPPAPPGGNAPASPAPAPPVSPGALPVGPGSLPVNPGSLPVGPGSLPVNPLSPNLPPNPPNSPAAGAAPPTAPPPVFAAAGFNYANNA